MRGIALEAPHIVEPLGQFYVDLLLASATRVPMPLLVKIAWLVAWMIVMLSGHLLLAILVAMAMLIQVAWCVAWMIVMLARFFLCHHLLLLLRSARKNAHGWAIVPTTHVMRQPWAQADLAASALNDASFQTPRNCNSDFPGWQPAA